MTTVLYEGPGLGGSTSSVAALALLASIVVLLLFSPAEVDQLLPSYWLAAADL